MEPPDLLDQPREIGRRIGAACGYSEKKQGEIADELDRDERTLRSYIKGKLGDYSTRELRLALIRRIEEITGCPPEIFGLDAPEPEALEELRAEALSLRSQVTKLLADVAALQAGEAELRSRVERLEP